jgi:protein-tyrosine phosphatase
MPEIVDWQRTADPRGAVRQVAEALGRGELVAFPTETVYGIAASALDPDAIERLRHCKGRPDEKPLTLAVGGADDALDWVPDMSPLGRRLARRCWPGPVTLVFADGVAEGLAGRLTDRVRERVCPAGTLGLRVPAHAAILEVMRHLPGPLALTSANRSGEPDATTAAAVVEAVGDGLAVVVDDGPSRYGQPSTVVKVADNSWQVLREGVVSGAVLQRLSCCMVVFVCTGNTCRSPLAEGLFKQLLAERLGCPVDELPQRGFLVLSAGITAMMGGRAAPEAVEAAREFGADLGQHVSQPLTPRLVEQADYLVAMTRGHLLALAERYQGRRGRPRLLAADGADVPDPIGCDQSVYRECARQIREHLGHLVSEIHP